MKATLLHKGKPVTKKIEHYTSVVATAMQHEKHLIKCSLCHDPDIPEKWSQETCNNID